MSGSGMSFGGGFASGLATVLSQKRQEDNRKSEQQIQNNWKLLGTLLNSGQVGDIADIQPFLDNMDLGLPKSKGKQGGPADHVTNILGHIIRNQSGDVTGGAAPTLGPLPATGLPQAASIQPQGPTGPNDAGEMQPATELPSRPLTMAPAPPAPRRTVNGIPLLTPDEVQQRKLDTETAGITNRVRLARERIFPALQAVDKDATMEDALAYAFGRVPPRTLAGRPQSIRGEVVNEDGTTTPAFAAFVNGRYVNPETGAAMDNFRPPTTTGSKSFGADREAIAGEPAFGGKSYAQLTPDQKEKVNAEAIRRAGTKAGEVATGRAQAEAIAPLSAAKSVDVQRQLQEDWTKANEPVKETKRQYDLMQVGLKRFREGDKIGGSQAVLVTFQKILDPKSVVRESEYARTPEGLGLLQRLEGMRDRLLSGGAGVPEAELAGMVQTAKEFTDGMEHYNDDVRRRLTMTARKANLNPADIFGDETAPTPAATGAPGKTGAATTTIPATKKVGDKWVITVPTP